MFTANRNGEESDNINYHILKTTYYEADPNDVTGLNVDALGVLFNPETAVSYETMEIQEWDAALYKPKNIAICAGHIRQKSAMFWNTIPKRFPMMK